MVKQEPPKKGMWAGRAGVAEGAEANAPVRALHAAQLQEALVRTAAMLCDVEKLIDEAGRVLAISQPPMAGKMAVRWWKLRGDSRYREPVVVRWMRQKNGRLTPRQAGQLVAKTHDGFAVNAKETQQVLDILRDLLAQRDSLKKRLEGVRKTLRGIENAPAYINNESVRLELLKARVVANLLARGYEVEAAYLPSEDEV